jgi:hypothetical protein
VKPEVFPHVSIDKASVDEFVEGTIGRNRASNKAALEKGAAIAATVVLANYMRRTKRARRRS